MAPSHPSFCKSLPNVLPPLPNPHLGCWVAPLKERVVDYKKEGVWGSYKAPHMGEYIDPPHPPPQGSGFDRPL